MTLHLQVSNNGRIIIPKKVRDSLGIKPGSMVIANLVDNTLQISSTKNSLKNARYLVKKYCGNNADLVDELLKTRKQESAKEEHKFKLKNKSND